MSRSKVALGTPCRAAAMPPMTSYLTFCFSQHLNIRFKFSNTFTLSQFGIYRKQQLGVFVEHVPPLLEQERLVSPDLGLRVFGLEAM